MGCLHAREQEAVEILHYLWKAYKAAPDEECVVYIRNVKPIPLLPPWIGNLPCSCCKIFTHEWENMHIMFANVTMEGRPSQWKN